MPQVASDYAKFSARYPELVPPRGPVTDELYELYFVEAGFYWRNDGTGPCDTDDQQLALLNMLSAHIAGINAVIAGALPYNVVGRISNASEGSVSIGTTLSLAPDGAIQEWMLQTRYGFAFWVATAAFRTMHYRPGPRRIFDPAQAVLYGRTGGFGW